MQMPFWNRRAKDYKAPSPLMDLLYRIPRPDMWIMLNPYDPEWDHFVRMGIQLNMVSLATPCTVHIGGVQVWVENYPYGSGASYTGPQVRPSCKTIKLLQKRVRALQMERGEVRC